MPEEKRLEGAGIPGSMTRLCTRSLSSSFRAADAFGQVLASVLDSGCPHSYDMLEVLDCGCFACSCCYTEVVRDRPGHASYVVHRPYMKHFKLQVRPHSRLW